MKRRMPFAVICVGLAFAFSLSHTAVGGEGAEIASDQSIEQVTCKIHDEAGTPITSANAGDTAKLSISHDSITNATRQFIFRAPSNDLATYQDTSLYVKKCTRTSSGGTITMKIQPWTYVERTGVFIGNVPGHVNCYAPLRVLNP